MTVFSDLTSDLTSVMGAIASEREKFYIYNAYLNTPPELPSSFADQAAYDVYDAAVTAWTANCASSLADWNSTISTLDGYLATIIARIPVAETLYTITVGGATYSIGKFADADGNYNLYYSCTGVAVKLLATGVIVAAGQVPTVTGS